MVMGRFTFKRRMKFIVRSVFSIRLVIVGLRVLSNSLAHSHTYTRAHKRTYIPTNTYTYTHLHTHSHCFYIYMYVCTCACVYTCARLYLCICEFLCDVTSILFMWMSTCETTFIYYERKFRLFYIKIYCCVSESLTYSW